MSKQYFPPWQVRYRQMQLTPEEIAKLLTVKQYAAKYNYSPSEVRYLIQSRTIAAYKLPARKWGVVDTPPPE